MREGKVQASILLAIGARPDVRAFRNTVGEGWMGQVVRHSGDLLTLRNPYRVMFGLCPGSPDLVGWHSTLITPDMVGTVVARFAGWEVKSATGRTQANQARFLDALRTAGGLASTVRSPEEALASVTGTLSRDP